MIDCQAVFRRISLFYEASWLFEVNTGQLLGKVGLFLIIIALPGG
jgi:hypothetical protein